MEILSEESVCAEQFAVLTEDWEDYTSTSKLVDREPRRCSEKKTAAKVILSVTLQLHLSRTNCLLVRVELAERLEFPLQTPHAHSLIPPALRRFVLLSLEVTTVHIA